MCGILMMVIAIVVTVSYTHLDVHKRQVIDVPRIGIESVAAEAA